ncbi:MAG TPA: HepT-like ribonuclease domain-containing protein [Roseiarcus sp.]|nr:HepT-like ribonuclease domain-containing protein [Roseiarcus sp.]
MAGRARRRDSFRGEPPPPDELKARHPEIPWPKVAGIGNVLRHDYESIAAPVM